MKRKVFRVSKASHEIRTKTHRSLDVSAHGLILASRPKLPWRSVWTNDSTGTAVSVAAWKELVDMMKSR